MKILTMIATAMTAISSAALAQPAVSDPSTVLPHVGFSSIEAVIRAVDPTVSYSGEGQNRKMLLSAGDIDVQLSQNACNQMGTCAGLILMSHLNETGSLDMINKFNATTPAARAFINDQGKVTLMHYIIGDFGVTKGSLVVNIGAFFSSVDKWNRGYSEQNLGNVVTFEPFTPEQGSFASSDAHLIFANEASIWPTDAAIEKDHQ